MRLFYSVEFSTTYLLYTFAELLDESPLLATYVHVVLVHGSSHNTPGDSVLAFFPTVMGGRLPNLQEISVYGTGGVSERRYHGNPGLAAHARKRVLPHLPLHPCFPILLTGLRRLTKLRLGVLTFPSFGDLGRILHTFIELQSLVCDALDWSVLGIVPPCMIKGERTYFLPELSELKVTWMGIYGTKRLLAALGPSLTCLDIHVPYFIPRKIRTDDVSEIVEHAIDLSPFPVLRDLTLRLSPALQNPEYLKLYMSMLHSWTPASAYLSKGRSLRFTPDWPASFSQTQFDQLMNTISSLTEDALLPSTRAGPGAEHRVHVPAAGPSEDYLGIQTIIVVQIPGWPDHSFRERNSWYQNWFPRSRKLKRARVVFTQHDPQNYPWESWRPPAKNPWYSEAKKRVQELLDIVRAEEVGPVPWMISA